jgi:hypothetical protein
VGRRVVVFWDINRWCLWPVSKNLRGGVRSQLGNKGLENAEAASERSAREGSGIFDQASEGSKGVVVRTSKGSEGGEGRERADSSLLRSLLMSLLRSH